MKKKVLLILFMALFVTGCSKSELKPLPKPELAEGLRGELGIDKNINEDAIDDYLGRSDSVYYDMRDLVDEADYTKIGGDSYISGTIKGFEVINFPKLLNGIELPEEVGKPYSGPALFTLDKDGGYTANYKESLEFLEYYFPKDKFVFLICGGGGYSGMTKELLVNYGWDSDKIYVVGGHWFYKGKNNLQIKRVVDGKDFYDFWKLTFHDINFDYFNEV